MSARQSTRMELVEKQLCILTAALGLLATSVACTDGAFAGAEKGKWERELLVDESFGIEEGDTLEVSVRDADVVLETGSADRVAVRIELAARNLERAKEKIERRNYRALRGANGIEVLSDRMTQVQWGFSEPYTVTVVVSVPEQFDANIRTSDGDVTLGRHEGRVEIRTGDGDVEIDRIGGTRLAVATSDGDVRVEDLTSADAEIQSSDGDIDVGTSRAGALVARTSDGDIRILRHEGALEARSSDGDLEVELASLTADVTLRSSDGDIDIVALSDLSADLELRGDSVALTPDDGFNGSVKERSLEGSIGGGGPRITATSGDGSVHVRRAG